MATNSYCVLAHRSDRAMYYALEFGTARAVELLKNENRSSAPVRMLAGTAGAGGRFRTRADAERWAQRAAMMVVAARAAMAHSASVVFPSFVVERSA